MKKCLCIQADGKHTQTNLMQEGPAESFDFLSHFCKDCYLNLGIAVTYFCGAVCLALHSLVMTRLFRHELCKNKTMNVVMVGFATVMLPRDTTQ